MRHSERIRPLTTHNSELKTPSCAAPWTAVASQTRHRFSPAHPRRTLQTASGTFRRHTPISKPRQASWTAAALYQMSLQNLLQAASNLNPLEVIEGSKAKAALFFQENRSPWRLWKVCVGLKKSSAQPPNNLPRGIATDHNFSKNPDQAQPRAIGNGPRTRTISYQLRTTSYELKTPSAVTSCHGLSREVTAYHGLPRRKFHRSRNGLPQPLVRITLLSDSQLNTRNSLLCPSGGTSPLRLLFLRGRAFGGIRLSVSYRVSVVPLAVSLRATHNSELRTYGLVPSGEASLKVQHLKERYTKATKLHRPASQALTRIVPARIIFAKTLSYSVTLHLQP